MYEFSSCNEFCIILILILCVIGSVAWIHWVCIFSSLRLQEALAVLSDKSSCFGISMQPS
jgi:hypothetical protein